MTPVVVRMRGSEEDILLIGFCSQYLAVCVLPGGSLTTVAIVLLVVEYGSTEWPMGYAFSRAASEPEPVA